MAHRVFGLLALVVAGVGWLWSVPVLVPLGLLGAAIALLTIRTPLVEYGYADTLPGFDSRTEPVRATQLEILDGLAEDQARYPEADPIQAGALTRSPKQKAMTAELSRQVRMGIDVLLLLGPIGTGKTEMARRVHLLLAQMGRSGEFVALNCGFMGNDEHLTSIVGHAEGAFTGAVGPRAGALQQARGGTVFLDEFGELTLPQQTKFLEILSKQIYKVFGSDVEVRADVVFVIATNRDLYAMVGRKEFRGDLLSRVDKLRFRMLGLRERSEDIEPLLDWYLDLESKALKKPLRLLPDARAALVEFATQAEWPDNLRGFAKAIGQLARRPSDGVITMEHVEAGIRQLREDWAALLPGDGLAGVVALEILEPMNRADRVLLADHVHVCREARSLSDGARTMYSPPGSKAPPDHSRLRRYLAQYGLTFEQLQRA